MGDYLVEVLIVGEVKEYKKKPLIFRSIILSVTKRIQKVYFFGYSWLCFIFSSS